MSCRIGIGFDIHRLVEGRPLVLGGIVVPFEKGLLGHSDGDVIIHAICDALLGALALGDIGDMFPDSVEKTKGMYSLEMLRIISEQIREEWRLVNIDVNCICERPKLAGYRAHMLQKIAETAGITIAQVSIKFRTHEGLGDIGHGEAVAAQAVVLMEKTGEVRR
jgi:2-C-methyl-D-erythritol 2,4-cyclodiphosphate synthase